MKITQRRFRYDGTDATEHWSIPMIVRVQDGEAAQTTPILLDGPSMTVETAPDALVVMNAGGEGFYRVAYPPRGRRGSSRAGPSHRASASSSSTTRGPPSPPAR